MHISATAVFLHFLYWFLSYVLYLMRIRGAYSIHDLLVAEEMLYSCNLSVRVSIPRPSRRINSTACQHVHWR